MFSTQADRDKATAEEDARIAAAQRKHVEEQSGGLRELVQANIALTERIAVLTTEVHAAACGPCGPPPARARVRSSAAGASRRPRR